MLEVRFFAALLTLFQFSAFNFQLLLCLDVLCPDVTPWPLKDPREITEEPSEELMRRVKRGLRKRKQYAYGDI